MAYEVCRVVKVEEPSGTFYFAERKTHFLGIPYWSRFYISKEDRILGIYELPSSSYENFKNPACAESICKEYMRRLSPDTPVKVWSID